ncbi:helix-turn-helix domain-containing protein [Denitrobaculum tricleocarpae]|uniref:Helix-turn-helix transcriptional regulator n=1 Tax=Denitrobaculum tricleocarpae TaxID=2591009 RepID=A0A545TXF5_9PROT|nr:helix-turn-helix transcriptional regulator [Denitrobaculum tricleocarpae]TQV81906.1 helix-turn-helix transcriptional regulator [Denitrobaculum tricleocarpae]
MTDPDKTATPEPTLGQVLRRAREQKGMQRTRLSEFSGINVNSIARYELAGQDGGKYPPMQNAIKLCYLLDLDPRTIFDSMLFHSDFEADTGFTFRNYFWQQDFACFQVGEVPDGVVTSAVERRITDGLSQIADRLERLEAKMESGPDQKDPSRPSQATRKAVGAASKTTPLKERKESS